MKRMKLWSIMMLVAMMGLPLMVACGGDDGGSSNPPRSKRISKIVEEREKEIIEREFTYDDQGRVIQMTIKSSNSSRNTKWTYQYGETLIIKKQERENPNSISKHVYNLSNGKIVKCGNWDFIYDSNGYMQKIGQGYDLKWDNGNLMSIMFSNQVDTLISYTYSNEVWKTGTFFDLCEIMPTGVDSILFAAGCYGKLPRNLPSSCKDFIRHISYKYTMSGGLLTKVEKQYDWADKIQGINRGYNSVIFITWE